MVIENGAFMESELNEVEWVVDPGDSTVKDIDHMIEIVGTLYDSDNEENGFEYRIYLRPWGTLWDDVAATQSDDFIYADMMPVDYDDWYLPELGLAPRETADTDFDEEDMEELWDMEGFDEDFIFEELDPENIPAE